jgi:hypothetical protein
MAYLIDSSDRKYKRNIKVWKNKISRLYIYNGSL